MADTENPTINVKSNKKPQKWWWRDEDYITQDSWNWLALAEIFFAITLYGGATYIFKTPWPLLIPIVLAPLFLLRSKSSINKGVELLEKSLNAEDLDRITLTTITALTATLGIALASWVSIYTAQDWLIGKAGWALVWRVGVIGAIDIAVILTIVITILGESVIHIQISVEGERRALLITTVGKTLLSVTGTGPKVIAVEIAVGVLFLPSFALGLCLHSLFIRLRATLTWKHIIAGVEVFSRNWYETVLVSNIRHVPALLPGAGQVSPSFTVAGLINLHTSSWLLKSLKGILVFSITLVATLYRWNIKASAPIWGPIAFGLRRTIWEPHQDIKKRKRAANLTSWLTIGSVLVLWMFLAVNWAKSFRNMTATSALNKTQSSFFADITDLVPIIPIDSLLFYVLTLLVICILCLFCMAFFAHNAHFPIFNNSNDWDGTKTENRAEGRKDAIYVTKALNWTLVSVYFFVCTVFFMLLAYFQTDLIKPFVNTNLWNFVASPQFMQALMK